MCWTFLVYRGYKMKLNSCCRDKKMQFSGATLRSLASLYIELEQFCCSLPAVKVCIWKIRPDSKFFKLENSICCNFCGSISIFEHVCAELQSLQSGVVRQKQCFLEVSQFEQQIGISEYFSRKVHDYQNFWAIKLLRSSKWRKVRCGHICPPSPSSTALRCVHICAPSHPLHRI